MSWLRRYAAELAVTVTVLVGTLFAVLSDRADPPHHAVLGWVLTVLCCAALFFRRRYPLSVAGFALVCCALYYPLTDPDAPDWWEIPGETLHWIFEGALGVAVILTFWSGAQFYASIWNQRAKLRS